MTREEIDEFVELTAPEHINDILLADDLDRAFIGIMFEPARAVYSIELCITELATSMSKAEAEEYFYYNVERGASYMGEHAPVFINTPV
tara:strand:+ start:2362 stop:2628 length:267 start_codon:yes stop_codon:yes gene_type:complete